MSDEFIDRLKGLYSSKYNESIEIEYNKTIRCLNPEHDDKNPSMYISHHKAQCFSCGYTISSNPKVKPYKEKIAEMVISKAIELCETQDVSEFIAERKYNPNVIKKLRIGKLTFTVHQQLLELFGRDNIKKAGLILDEQPVFINKVIIPINETYFSAKPSGVSIKGKPKQPYILNGEQDIMIICEGECDAIALHHIYPRHNIMALLGAEAQKPLKKISQKEVWLCFDNDEAGRKAEIKAGESLKSKTIKRVYFEDRFKDIDEAWRELQYNLIDAAIIKEYQPPQVYIPKDIINVSKDALKETITNNFPNMWEIVDCCLSVVAVNKIEDYSDVVNVNLVGVPSGEKTTCLSLFYGVEDITYKTDEFTPKAFVSHSANVTEEELEEIDMLPRIKDKCIITPELGAIFAKRKEDLTELLGLLTRVFDGEGLESDTGARGRRGYSGEYLFTMLAATTPISKTAWNIMGKLGSRMFFLCMPDQKTNDDDLINIVTGDKSYKDKICLCKEVIRHFVYNLFKDGIKRNVKWNSSKNTKDAAIVIVNCAKMLARLRASIQVWEDEYSNGIYHESPLVEQPTRIISIFQNIAKGHAITENRDYITMEDVYLIPKIMMSTMPEDRMHGIKALLNNYGEAMFIEDIAAEMKVSEKVARKTMETLKVLEVVQIEQVNVQKNTGATHKLRIELNSEFKKWMDTVLFTFLKNDTALNPSLTFPDFTSGDSYMPFWNSKSKKDHISFIQNTLYVLPTGEKRESEHKGTNTGTDLGKVKKEETFVPDDEDILAWIEEAQKVKGGYDELNLIETIGQSKFDKWMREGTIYPIGKGKVGLL